MNLNAYSFREGDLFLLCGYRQHDYILFAMLKEKYNMIMINTPRMLTKELVDKLNPKMLFFPNWSWKVPKDIVDSYQCVCFHEGDLPKGRGGSPIQNHIIRGIKDTKSTACLMIDRIDAGPIFCKRNLNLSGSLDNIFQRIIKNNYELTIEIIEKNPQPIPQDESEAEYYTRRKPEDSEIDMNEDMTKIYDFIRMLADPYPNAFLMEGSRKIIFKDAKFDNGVISGRYEIR